MFEALIANLIQRNPNVANSERGKEALDIIKSGDSARGEALARNLCQSYGTTPEEATKQAQNWFGGLFGGLK